MPVTIRDIDRGAKRLRADLRKLAGATTEVGYFGHSKDANGVSNVDKAIWQEFGVPKKNIPPRPFMRQSWNTGFRELSKEADRLVVAYLYDHRRTVAGIMNRLGKHHVLQIKATILRSNTWAKANAKATVKRKGRQMPLLDTFSMLAAVRHRITSGSKTR